MKFNLNLSLKYITNIKPAFIQNELKKTQISSLKVRQFFYFIFLLSIFNEASVKNLFFYKPKVFTYKTVSALPNFLRAPYKNKKAQISLQKTRYTVLFHYKLSCQQLYLNLNLKYLFLQIFSLFLFFDSPLLFLYKQSCLLYVKPAYIF